MVYLDYAATTPVDKRVLESFDRVSIEYFANANSIHLEGATDAGLAYLMRVEQLELLGTLIEIVLQISPLFVQSLMSTVLPALSILRKNGSFFYHQ